MAVKRVVCDSSALISISDNCLLRVLKGLGNVQLVIPQQVKYELVEKPLRTKRFALKALIMKHFIQHETIAAFNDPRIGPLSEQILGLANRVFEYKGRGIQILHGGEAQALACYKIMEADALLVDERTTRLLLEDAGALKKYIERRTGYALETNKKAVGELQRLLGDVCVARSAEIFAYAYEKGLFSKLGGIEALEAALYALKFSGCAVSDDEIQEYVSFFSA